VEETPETAPSLSNTLSAPVSPAKKTVKEEAKEDPAIDRGHLLPFFEVEEALTQLKGRSKLYVVLLRSYLKNDMIEKIEEALLRGDFEEALQNALALNNVAVNLGLRNLQFKAALLAEAFRGGVMDKELLEKVKLSAEETRRLVPNLILHLEKGKTAS
jgi:HPt (histidine-containing phosphotransfer) domain-containing protein